MGQAQPKLSERLRGLAKFNHVCRSEANRNWRGETLSIAAEGTGAPVEHAGGGMEAERGKGEGWRRRTWEWGDQCWV